MAIIFLLLVEWWLCMGGGKCDEEASVYGNISRWDVMKNIED
jgi:hypothetical protein